ncbi:hypothetical protein T12_8043 [Trichinella patagoniensis]|uniref:Retrotransposon gag domain-containing protein n=1 Tax=Trichinella patagoniensis TaxID=990121 RepID=A0A0V0ZLW5_9BILA|nr:hypothetical protein T12_8043 [Trichinella patagoniensis]
MYFRAARITTERRNGERGRIDGLEWVRPPEVLTMSSNVEIWFEHMEMYFRAAHIGPERRAALVQYHTDAEVRGVMRAMHVQETDDYDGLKSALFEAFGVRTCPERFSAEFFRRKQQRGESVRVYAGHLRWLFPKAFPGLSGAADKILLQQFKAGLSADAVKIAVLRSGTDSFEEAIEVAAREERVWRELTTLKASVSSVKADADQEDKQPAVEVTEATAAAVTTRKEVGGELAELVRQLKELLTSNTLRLQIDRSPSGDAGRRRKEAYVAGRAVDWATSAGSAKLPPATNARAKMRQGNIPFLKSHAVAPVRAESPQPELMTHQPVQEAMEKMLPSEQESSGKHRSALAAILREFSDVLPTSDEDLVQTSVVRHAIHTGDAKPVRCSPRRIPYYQRAQVEALVGEMLRRDVVEPSRALGIPYREEERWVMSVLCRLQAAEQLHPEGCPPAPED